VAGTFLFWPFHLGANALVINCHVFLAYVAHGDTRLVIIQPFARAAVFVRAFALLTRCCVLSVDAGESGNAGTPVRARACAGDGIVAGAGSNTEAVEQILIVAAAGTGSPALGPGTCLAVGLVWTGASFASALAIAGLAALACKWGRADTAVGRGSGSNFALAAVGGLTASPVFEHL